jgi:redox-sensitive bicupin YhaK (pirin superfamily)
MIEHRPFAGLGRFGNDWLQARYHFSFADYYDPARMGVGPLRVWNDDTIRPGGRFPMHGHRDMEIITYVRRGAISHEDHLGNKGRTEAGQVQVMTAGRGIMHSEYNHEPGETQMFQIWIQPREDRLPATWDSRPFPVGDRAGRLVALASGEAGHPDALPINQDATLYAATLGVGDRLVHELGAGRHSYLVAARGALTVNGLALGERDGAAIADEARLEIAAEDAAELVLVDLP